MNSHVAPAFVGGLVVGALALVVVAGNLTPPPGPVTGTGRTLTEVYDEVVALGGSGGAGGQVSDLQAGVPGDGSRPFMFFGAFSSDDFVTEVFEVEFGTSIPVGAGGGAAGPAMAEPMVIRKRFDRASAVFLEAYRTNTTSGQVTLELVDAENAPIGALILGNASVSSVRHFKDARNDGTFPFVEEVTIQYTTAAYQVVGGSTVVLNY